MCYANEGSRCFCIVSGSGTTNASASSSNGPLIKRPPLFDCKSSVSAVHVKWTPHTQSDRQTRAAAAPVQEDVCFALRTWVFLWCFPFICYHSCQLPCRLVGSFLSLSLWLGQFGLCVNLYKNLPATATTTSSVIIVVNSFAALCTIKCIMCSAVWPFQLVLGLSPTLGFKQKTVQLFLTKMVLPSNLLPSLCFLFFLKFTSFGSSALASATDAHILCHLLSFQHSSMRQMFLTCWPHQIYFW